MKKPAGINLNPRVLIALREASGYTIEEVAKKLKVNIERVKKQKQGSLLLHSPK